MTPPTPPPAHPYPKRRPHPSALRTALLCIALSAAACQAPQTPPAPGCSGDSCPQPAADTVPQSAPQPARYTPTEQRLADMGLVDLQQVDSTIMVHLVYATPDNFTGQVLYTGIRHAFMLPQLADKLAAAQRELRTLRPELSLMVLDAARPLSVQRSMFRHVQGTPLNLYVSNPRNGPGLHNYGAAVDITLADTAGNPVPMGSGFDWFGPESHIDNEAALVASGRITQAEYDNRRLLRGLMQRQGLIPFRAEWWHFNLMSRSRAQQTLKALDF